mgnify:CR=1 FL=1
MNNQFIQQRLCARQWYAFMTHPIAHDMAMALSLDLGHNDVLTARVKSTRELLVSLACQIVNYWSVELKDMSSVCRSDKLSDCYWVCKVFHILDNIWHPSDELYNFRCYVLRVSFHNYFQHQPFKIDWPTTGSEKSRKPPNYIRMVSILQDNDSRS